MHSAEGTILGAWSGSVKEGSDNKSSHLLSTYCIPGSVLSVFKVLCYSILTTTLHRIQHYCSHFTDEKTEATAFHYYTAGKG